ncbi:MAG: electron transfer flavoprotein subunit beta/FixA family protein [Levilactobacillus sp.]|jgi:electron transfer flavoprotein beta subunit|uniref:Electron transfer flavoprotein small subunit n=1 Tax=Levilactobacillus suantsaiihabitans TaxID=2487722 RepID=A0A4Z0JCR8_9LACO|nr:MULTISPECIES: electron transfer flavoprotein subunit beta/FixA family protein [Levilactobacillus]MCH4123575.1 electron transfer flavoprotein subunit beta/FixA family protein [Levilactobacillus sp.]MCI1553674.1 electron transfer flavoprotein subunit beta/FixA family protein [Levilactobacillus sp.]MCI1599199.1 electron transfer flavoprotein subunit beta/FixA family protein [Levilactobacillus sp.]MCI1605826.1 electron transfer flavoprotein subunit beta/FixA family protein [Levilactobacillus sp.
MKIVVCIKQVPETNDVKIDPVTHNLDRRGLAGVMNPFDKNAIELALTLKDSRDDVQVALLTMGPDDYAESLREGMAMGADEGYLLSDRAFAGADTLATGYVIAQALKKIGDADLILFGRQAVDADTGQVGPIVAEFLHQPQITYAASLRLSGANEVTAERLLEDTKQTLVAQLPAVVSVRSELNTPRYPTPRNIQLSFAKPLTVWHHDDLDLDDSRLGQAGSPTIVTKVYAPEPVKRELTPLTGTPSDAASQLITALKNRQLI